MSKIKQAQGNFHLEGSVFDGERKQSASSLDEPAVTAMLPIIAWPIAIWWAEGWSPWEWANNISPPMIANMGNGETQTA